MIFYVRLLGESKKLLLAENKHPIKILRLIYLFIKCVFDLGRHMELYST